MPGAPRRALRAHFCGRRTRGARIYNSACEARRASGHLRGSVEPVRTLHETFRHPGRDEPESDSRDRREQHALEAEIDEEMDFGPGAQRHKTPTRVEPLKWSFDMTCFDR